MWKPFQVIVDILSRKKRRVPGSRKIMYYNPADDVKSPIHNLPSFISSEIFDLSDQIARLADIASLFIDKTFYYLIQSLIKNRNVNSYNDAVKKLIDLSTKYSGSIEELFIEIYNARNKYYSDNKNVKYIYFSRSKWKLEHSNYAIKYIQNKSSWLDFGFIDDAKSINDYLARSNKQLLESYKHLVSILNFNGGEAYSKLIIPVLSKVRNKLKECIISSSKISEECEKLKLKLTEDKDLFLNPEALDEFFTKQFKVLSVISEAINDELESTKELWTSMNGLITELIKLKYFDMYKDVDPKHVKDNDLLGRVELDKAMSYLGNIKLLDLITNLKELIKDYESKSGIKASVLESLKK